MPQVVESIPGVAGAGLAGYPMGSTPLHASSGNVANAAAVATLAATAGQTTYITGFEVTAAGATAGLAVNVTLAGCLNGTQTFTFAAPIGALVVATPLSINFSNPIPASAPNTTIVLTLPALGLGNTNAAVVAHGFRV